MRCPSCGAKYRLSKTHCPKCGVPIDPKVAAFGGAARNVREAWGLEAREEAAVVHAKRPATRYLAFGAVALVLVLVLAVALAFIQRTSKPGQERLLNATNFADESLVAILSPYDTDRDGALSPAEAAAVTELDCAGMGLRSLGGIELFANLTKLDASGNALTSVDLSGLAHLEQVDLSDNAISTLDAHRNLSLSSLDVHGNGMTSLNVAGCRALASLNCTGNNLARLDLAGCNALVSLSCDAGQNVTIPIAEGFFPDAGLRRAVAVADADGDGALTQRERQALAALAVQDPATESLFGLAWFANLSELSVGSTALETLDAAVLPPSLTSIAAPNCRIAQVDLAGLDHLTSLDLAGNPLTAVNLSVLPRLSNLNLANCQLEGLLDVSFNPRLTTLDVTGNPKLSTVYAAGVPGLSAPGAVAHDATCSVQTAASGTAHDIAS